MLDPHRGKTYADRFPKAFNDDLWCLTCGAARQANELNWWQDCRECEQWWDQNALLAPGTEEQTLWTHVQLLWQRVWNTFTRRRKY